MEESPAFVIQNPRSDLSEPHQTEATLRHIID
jgi:hypothetical protein